MKADKKSSRHHLVPVFYLKKFVGEDDKFYTYDKISDRIKVKKMSPKQVCFIWDRNTVDINGSTTSFIEDSMLSGLDATIGVNLNIFNIVDIESHSLTISQLYAVRSLLLHVFWRSPKNDDLIDYVNKHFPLSFTGLEFIDKKTGEINNPEMESKMRDEEVVKKTYQALLPIKSIMLEGNIHRWRLLQVAPEYQLISDYPILHRYRPDSLASVLENDVIMPMSSRLSLTNVMSERSLIDAKYRYYQELLIFHEAIRHVCCENEEYLKIIMIEYQRVRDKIDWDETRAKLFSCFD